MGFGMGLVLQDCFFGKKQNNYNRWHHSFVPVAQSQSKMHVFVSRVLFGYSKMTILASTKLCFSFFYHFCFEMIFSGNEYSSLVLIESYSHMISYGHPLRFLPLLDPTPNPKTRRRPKTSPA